MATGTGMVTSVEGDMPRTAGASAPRTLFHQVANERRIVGFALTGALLMLWFGFVLLVAFAKQGLSAVIVPGITWALAAGTGVMLGSWLLGGVYMVWAERRYDGALLRIRSESGN